MASVDGQAKANVCLVQSWRFERRTPKDLGPDDRVDPLVVGVLDASWATACAYARQVFHTDELLDKPVLSSHEVINPDGKTFVAKSSGSPDVILRWQGTDAGPIPTRHLVVLVPSVAAKPKTDPATVRAIVAWMREEYPQNRHAREWAGAIEKQFTS